MARARLVGINHVALEVGDIDAALEFYGRLFEFELRGRNPQMAFIDMGDQFLALSTPRHHPPDVDRHFGLVVDDKDATRQAIRDAGIDASLEHRVRFQDPWGNTVEVVDYRDIQFTKEPAILEAMGFDGLEKTASARRELADKGLSGAAGR